jgi:hypothetical protein
MIERYRTRVRHRIASVRMLHIGLNNNFWHAEDILFVLTGWVWK